jgi:C4-dicarboxylate-specific signal transduction histidine kinase
MPCAENTTSAVPVTGSSQSYHPNPPDAVLGQLSASIAEINQTITAVVMNAEAALRLLGAQPNDPEAVRRLLVCIVKDGMRTGDVVNRTRALIKNAPPGSESLEAAAALSTDVDPH